MASERARSDSELLAASRGRDGEAFGAFFRRHRGTVLGYLAARTRSREVAADLLAETFAAALAVVREPSRELPGEPLAWLMTIARNKLIDSVRHGRVEQSARDELGLAPLAIDDHDLERIEELIDQTDVAIVLAAQLPPEQLVALRARVLDERDYGDIAAELQCSQAVVRKRVSRALRTLRAALEAPE
ncbi:MAG: RNA polymerase sigma factor [Solirubrobacteraceae bacterium]